MDGRDFGCSGALRQKEERKRPATVSNDDEDDGKARGVNAILLM